MPGESGKQQALDLFEISRPDLLNYLRAFARIQWDRYGQPLSTNDIRSALEASGYSGDPRILGAVFRGWKPVGWTTVKSKANARPIRLFVP